MISTSHLHQLIRLCVAAVFTAAVLPRTVVAQPAPPRVVSKDSVSVVAGTHYDASSFQRFFLGNTYRDLWTTPVRVPVLNLRTYAGGLTPLKEGGGKQTKNLRLGAFDGTEYVFRLHSVSSARTPVSTSTRSSRATSGCAFTPRSARRFRCTARRWARFCWPAPMPNDGAA